MKKLLTPFVLSAVLGASAFGATATLTQFSFGPHLLDFANPPNKFTIPTVLSSPGVECPPGSTFTLNSVRLAMAAQIGAIGSIRNNDETGGAPINATLSYTGPITLTVPGGVIGGGALSVAQNLVFAGIGPIAGQTSVPFGPAGNGGNDVEFAANLAAFTGPGTVDIGITSLVAVSLAGGANAALSYGPGEGAFGLVTLDVTYDYTCVDRVIPEPKVYGLIGAALSLGVLGYRQYRSKKA